MTQPDFIKPYAVDTPIANETSLQFPHNEEFSSFYFALIDRKQTYSIIKFLTAC